MTRDEIRTAGLLFGEELALGLIEPEALRTPEVQRAVRAHPVPSSFSRRYQQRQMRKGRLTYDRHVVQPLMAARRTVLGDAAPGRPKLLIRLDAFPHPDAFTAGDESVGTRAAAIAHGLLHGAGVPYLMAVTPRVPERPLDKDADQWREHDHEELALLAQLRRDGVEFGAYGLDARTVTGTASSPSEFAGRKRQVIDERLESALGTLRGEAIHTDVFVAPYDRFDGASWPAFASRFDVVCGGPASVGTMGFHGTPSWRGDAVYLPAYAPLAGTAAEVLPAVRRLADEGTGLWIPVALRWDAEQRDGWRGLTELAAFVGDGELARSWEDFLLAARASRQLALTLER